MRKKKKAAAARWIFRLLPNPAEKTLEILSNTGPNPWMGRVRRRWDEWGNPIEMEFVTSYAARNFQERVVRQIREDPALRSILE